MQHYYALTANPLPPTLHGADSDYSIRPLAERERLMIEDHFFKKDIRIRLRPDTTAVVVPYSQSPTPSIDDVGMLVEFALAVLTISGFAPVDIVAILNDASQCNDALYRPRPAGESPIFAKRVVHATASTWMRYFFAARKKTKDGLHITADRFVRYSAISHPRDALVDLCICLESLIEAQTEISFRFATCLAKVSAQSNAKQLSGLLSDLYDFRSKVVHGTDSTKEHGKLKPHLETLRFAARTILTTYVLYMAQHSKEEWKGHLRSCLFT